MSGVLNSVSRLFAPCIPGSRLPPPESCTPEQNYEIGIKYWQKGFNNPLPGNTPVALRHFEALLDPGKSPKTQHLANVGSILRRAYHGGGAPYFERAIELGSRDPKVFENLADHYYERDNHDPKMLTLSASRAQLGLERTGDKTDPGLVRRLARALGAARYPDHEKAVGRALELVGNTRTREQGEGVLASQALVEKRTRVPMTNLSSPSYSVRPSFNALSPETRKAALDYLHRAVYDGTAGKKAERAHRILEQSGLYK